MIAAAALVLLQGVTPPPAPQVVDARLRGPQEWYLELVDRYRRGDRAGAIAQPAAPESSLLEVNALRRQAEAVRCVSCAARDRIETFRFEAAVLLHTERALDRIGDEDSMGPAELEIAPRLVAIMPAHRRRAFEPRWLRAATQLLCRSGEWGLALKLLEPALPRYAEDPLLLLAHGAALESKARFDADRIHVESSLMGRHRRTESAQRSHLVEAEKSYRKALSLRPHLHPARVRLARVLQMLGRHEASIPELQTVTAATTDARTLYLAYLFLGSAQEAAGLLDQAVAGYEQAVRVQPDGQAAAVALSHALHRHGRQPESASALQSGVSRAGRRVDVDPWWPYLTGEGEDADALLEVLRAEASR